MPPVDGNKAWRTLTRAIAQCLAELDEGDFLIIAHRHINHYVQVAGQGEHGFRVEAASNTYIEPPSAALTTVQYAEMDTLGWHRATEDPPELATVQRDSDGSPNFYRQVDVGDDLDAVADVMIRTLHEVYGVESPKLLEYQAFHRDLGEFVFPHMPIARRMPEAW